MFCVDVIYIVLAALVLLLSNMYQVFTIRATEHWLDHHVSLLFCERNGTDQIRILCIEQGSMFQ